MSDEQTPPPFPENTAPKPAAPAPAAARPAAAAPKFDLPKAKYGIANKAGAPVQVQVKKSDNPSILSVAIDGLAAAVAVAFAVLIILDI